MPTFSGRQTNSPMRRDAATHRLTRRLNTYVTLLDHLGFANGLLVQGNAHGFDNRVVLDALALSAAPTWHRNN